MAQLILQTMIDPGAPRMPPSENVIGEPGKLRAGLFLVGSIVFGAMAMIEFVERDAQDWKLQALFVTFLCVVCLYFAYLDIAFIRRKSQKDERA